MDKNVLGLAKPAPATGGGEAATQDVARTDVAAKGADPADWPLVGVVTGARKAAMISEGGTVRIVFMGEFLKGWELAEVRDTGVAWRSGKATREMLLRKEERGQPERQPAKTEAEPRQGVPTSSKLTVSKAELDQYLDDPNNLLQQARFTPYKKDGKVEGFRLGNIRGDSVFRRMGLQNGDVLMALNGERIDGPEKLLRVYSSLKAAQAVNLNIRRQGEIQSLMVEFN